MRRIAILSLASLCVFAPLCADDDPATITTFQLRDGRTLEALRFSKIATGGVETYFISTLDGQRHVLKAEEIVSSKEALVALAALPEAARNEIRKQRAVTAAARTRAEADAAAQKTVAEAKRAENQARAVVTKLTAELNGARETLARAETVIRNAPIEVARADARYEAARTELGSLSSGYVGPNTIYVGNPNRADYLRALMVRAAEEKALALDNKKEAEAILARTSTAARQLEDALTTALKDLAAAQAESRKAIMQAHAVPERNEDLTIRVGPAVP
jgi:hypothetical protein